MIFFIAPSSNPCRSLISKIYKHIYIQHNAYPITEDQKLHLSFSNGSELSHVRRCGPVLPVCSDECQPTISIKGSCTLIFQCFLVSCYCRDSWIATENMMTALCMKLNGIGTLDKKWLCEIMRRDCTVYFFFVYNATQDTSNPRNLPAVNWWMPDFEPAVCRNLLDNLCVSWYRWLLGVLLSHAIKTRELCLDFFKSSM